MPGQPRWCHLVVSNALANNVAMPGNMFCPIDVLKPVLGDLPARGRPSMRPGNLLLGIAGQPVRWLPNYYRKLWSSGRTGVEVPLLMVHDVVDFKETVE